MYCIYNILKFRGRKEKKKNCTQMKLINVLYTVHVGYIFTYWEKVEGGTGLRLARVDFV